MKYFWECVLEGSWEFRRGDDTPPLDTALNAKPTSSSFDEFRESNRVLGEADKLIHGEKLPPEALLVGA
ncbi:MAG: hypothetical protein WDZ59_09535 [Pirellulales bacterium]